MNPIVKILSAIIIKINALMEDLDKQTVESIKQISIGFVIIALLLSIIAGYRMGKKSAKIHGRQMAESTNKTFQIDIKRAREEGRFRSLVDSDLINEMGSTDINKVRYPMSENIDTETEDKIIESKSPEKIKIDDDFKDREKLAEISRDDEKPIKPGINKLERRDHILDGKKKHNIIKDSDRKIDGNTDIRDSGEDHGPVYRKSDEGKKLKKQKPGKKGKSTLGPIEKDSRIIEK